MGYFLVCVLLLVATDEYRMTEVTEIKINQPWATVTKVEPFHLHE